MIILGLDFSYSKSGYSISKIDLSNGNIKLIDCGLLLSNKDEFTIQRISNHCEDIVTILDEYEIDYIVKESAIMGRASTGLPVIKAHGVLEYILWHDDKEVNEIHNATIKAWARNYLINNDHYNKNEIKTLDKKKVVAEAVVQYYNEDNIKELIYTPRGRLLDDVADAIAIGIVAGEKYLNG